jgi:hypothetical protein
MISVSSIRRQLEQSCDLNMIRCAIADLIIHQLQHSQAAHNLAALDHLTNAVGTLTLNVDSTRQPTQTGLPLCLRDIEQAIAELDGESDDSYTLLRKRAEAVIYHMLTEAVQVIRDKASCDASDGDRAE